MKERPILFSAPMVRAIMEGRKTMTRRVCKIALPEGIEYEPNPEDRDGICWSAVLGANDIWGQLRWLVGAKWGCQPLSKEHEHLLPPCVCPYGVKGDRLWVRENFYHGDGFYDDKPDVAWKNWHGIRDGVRKATWIDYQADMDDARWREFNDDPWAWKPSIFMPRWASRITLEITGVRVERLNEITYDDAVSEGLVYEDGVWSVDDKNGKTISRCVDPRDTFMQLWSSINGRESWDANPWVWVVEFQRIKP